MALYIAQAYCCLNTQTDSAGNTKLVWEVRNTACSGNYDIWTGFQKEIDSSMSENGAQYITVGGSNINIYQLGVQTVPGVKMQLNNNITGTTGVGSMGGTVIVGQTGIFELNLAERTPVNQIAFTNLLSVFQSRGDNVNYLIVDLIYEEIEG